MDFHDAEVSSQAKVTSIQIFPELNCKFTFVFLPNKSCHIKSVNTYRIYGIFKEAARIFSDF